MPVALAPANQSKPDGLEENEFLPRRDDTLSVTATDLEVELVAQTELEVKSGGEITVSGRKLLDICRALPDGAKVEISASGEKLNVRSGRSKFSLATLPAAEFPTIEEIKAGQTIPLPQDVLARLIEKTHFSMAQQDVRYYLNGMLLETGGKHVRTVATDGHRLALCQAELDGASLEEQQVIVPRKGVLELQRLMSGEGVLNVAGRSPATIARRAPRLRFCEHPRRARPWSPQLAPKH